MILQIRKTNKMSPKISPESQAEYSILANSVERNWNYRQLKRAVQSTRERAPKI